MTAQSPSAPTTGATVVLDIGAHVGALIVHAPAELAGEEIEIRPRGAAWAGVHTAVRARHVRGAVIHAGLFDHLASGLYDLRLRPPCDGERDASRPVTVTVEVCAGAVTETSLSQTSPCRQG